MTETAAPLLSLNNIEVIYDRVALAVKGASIEVASGGMVALLGANGAGKSTLLKSISGLLKAERGEVTRGELHFKGRSIDRLSPQARVQLGIVQVLEGRRVFEHLTPDENLVAASAVRGSRAERGMPPLPLSDEKFDLFGLSLPTWGIYAATANLSVTLALALITFLATHFEGIRYNGARRVNF